MPKDYLSDTSQDLRVENGDFVSGNSEVQEQNRILEAFPGEYKRTPTVGVGIEEYLNASVSRNELKKTIRKAFVKDGFKVDSIEIEDDFSEIDIQAFKS